MQTKLWRTWTTTSPGVVVTPKNMPMPVLRFSSCAAAAKRPTPNILHAAVSAEDFMHFGTSGGVIAEAERLVCQGEPEKAIAHLRDHLDGTRRLRAEDL